LAVGSKEVAFLYRTAANFLKDKQFPIVMSCNNQHEPLLQLSYFVNPAAKSIKQMSPFSFLLQVNIYKRPGIKFHKTQQKSTTSILLDYPN